MSAVTLMEVIRGYPLTLFSWRRIFTNIFFPLPKGRAMELEIDGVSVRIGTHWAKKALWCTAEWECPACGIRGTVTIAEQQDTEAGAYMRARGQAERHIAERHPHPQTVAPASE